MLPSGYKYTHGIVLPTIVQCEKVNTFRISVKKNIFKKNMRFILIGLLLLTVVSLYSDIIWIPIFSR